MAGTPTDATPTDATPTDAAPADDPVTGCAPGQRGRTGWWRCLAVTADGRRDWLALVASDSYSDGESVELLTAGAQLQVGESAVAVARFDADGEQVVQLRPGPRVATSAPPLWFAEVRETAAAPPAVSLVAFTGHGVTAGTLVDASELDLRSVRSADQVGAVRWWPASGEVDQVYVQPQWRRLSISGVLISSAAVLSYARGWARLWGDGQRTELGEAMRSTAGWRGRSAELTHVAPPMTPPEA